ncbi:MAG: nuclear transport factor 2 family protein [Solirubrobacterales bacterium]
MTTKKTVVDRYIEGFRRRDHDLILSCLTDEVTWEMPGFFELHGKTACNDEIENDAFEGSPTITIDRLIEEGDAVVAIGAVRSPMKNGTTLEAVFCDVFTFVGDKIHRLETYQVNLS